MTMNTEIEKITSAIAARLSEKHECVFNGESDPVLLISADYPGIWLEHTYDSLFYARMYPEKAALAENAVSIFLDHQFPDGQFPSHVAKDGYVGYSQIQECVSFARLSYEIYKLRGDKILLKRIYTACDKWDKWLCENRMTLGRGLVELFVGFDSGHDRSSRLDGLKCPGNYRIDGVAQRANILPPDESVAPIIAVDMNCNMYASRIALSEMADELGYADAATEWREKAKEIKQRLFEVCYDPEDAFFYDVDKNGNKRKYLSCTVFHLFMEHLLDRTEDKEIIDEIYKRHISNEKEFNTPYAFPSMAICDPGWRKNAEYNCWSYFTQTLTMLRATLWMDDYGYTEHFEHILGKWFDAWTRCYDKVKLGQELDPITGEPSLASEWYSSSMLLYLYAAKRLTR